MQHIVDTTVRRRLALGLFVPAKPRANRRRRAARHWAKRAANVRILTWSTIASVILAAAAVISKLILP